MNPQEYYYFSLCGLLVSLAVLVYLVERFFEEGCEPASEPDK